MLIEILAYQGTDELDAIGPLEVLRNVGAGRVKMDTRLVTLDDQQEVTGSHGLRFRADGVLNSSGRPDVLLVPGGGWTNRTGPGAWAEAQRGAVPQAIARLYKEGALLASVCTGTMLLAAAGLVQGRHATTHRSALDDLRHRGAQVVDARVVDDGDIITAGGVTSGIDLGLYLVERFASAEIARKIGNAMEYERRGPVWMRPEHAAAWPFSQ
jgi:transcriptional regulator GlxA family with amidase domain